MVSGLSNLNLLQNLSFISNLSVNLESMTHSIDIMGSYSPGEESQFFFYI